LLLPNVTLTILSFLAWLKRMTSIIYKKWLIILRKWPLVAYWQVLVFSNLNGIHGSHDLSWWIKGLKGQIWNHSTIALPLNYVNQVWNLKKNCNHYLGNLLKDLITLLKF
jgi:hypothetical protein